MYFIKTGYHIFKGKTGNIYVKRNVTPSGKKASGRLGETVLFIAATAPGLYLF